MNSVYFVYCILNCIKKSSESKRRKMVLPFFFELLRPHPEHCVPSSAPERIWKYWRKFRDKPQMWSMCSSFFCIRRDWENWAWRVEGSGGISSACINTWREGEKKVKSISVVPSRPGQEAMGTHWNRKFHLSVGKHILPLSGWNLSKVSQKACGVCILGDIQKVPEHGSVDSGTGNNYGYNCVMQKQQQS